MLIFRIAKSVDQYRYYPRETWLYLSRCWITKTVNTSKVVTFGFGDQTSSTELRYKNRFHYVPIVSDREINQLFIQSDHDKLAIEPIYRDKSLLVGKPKLIVHIFVDALAQTILEDLEYSYMPSIKDFFADESHMRMLTRRPIGRCHRWPEFLQANTRKIT